jgi:hypothetical protein
VDMDYIALLQDREKWRNFVQTVLNIGNT